MHKKIMTLLIVLIFSVSCLAVVAQDNNTTINTTSEELEDLTDYIIAISTTAKGIEFSDGFTGFCLDLSKDAVNVDDKFTSAHTNDDKVENNVKMAIIECYKTGNENNLQNIVSQVLNGNKEYDVLNATFKSNQIADDTIVVDINNDTEATFTFELLKSNNAGKSDCLAYKISTKAIAKDDVLSASNDDANDTLETTTENNTKSNDQLAAGENNTQTANGNENNNTPAEKKNAGDDSQTIINETNTTTINKNNTVIVNENNTTIINQKNVKTINKTNETPKNATIQDQIMRTVGNPIFLLVVVIVIIAVVAVAMRRKN